MSSFLNGLDPEEIEILESEQIISASVNGKRKVSTGLLTVPKAQASQLLTLRSLGPEISDGSTTSSNPARQRLPSIKDFELPENLECVALVEFLGYTRTKAAEIFTRWAARPDPESNPYSLKKYAITELINLERAPIREILHQPAEAMRSLGISNEMIDSMTAPEHKDLFEAETLVYWLEAAMRSRYGTVERYLNILKTRAIRTLHKKKGKKRGKLEGVFQQALAPETSTSSTTGSAMMSMESEFSGDMFPREHVTIVQTPPENREDYIIMYKGKGVGIAYQSVRTLIREAGQLNMHFMESYSGGDFNGQGAAWYWTRERETAEKYRKWAANLDPHGETWIMQIQVPESFMKSVHVECLWYGFDWKQYVWYCKKMSPRDDMPQNIHKYANADVLEGHICRRHPSKVPMIRKEDIQEKIKESDCLLLSHGKKATQTVFMKESGMIDRLEPLIRGNLYIEVHLP
ncbi:hypothetical protein EAF04_003130 [Stromatinia cepivora]|nr:hypothetical protein EAF04_003130 [Stromatinia cepivora]